MNPFRSLVVFGLLLTMLWLFGLMVAYKRTAGDDTAVLATMQSVDAKVESITVKYHSKEKAEDRLFVLEEGNWYLKKGEQKLRLERFRVDQLLNAIKNARKDDYYRPSDNLAEYELSPPRVSFTLKGKLREHDKEWFFNLGKETADKAVLFVQSSDRPDKAYAVDKKSLDDLFIKNINSLRSKQLFEFSDTSVRQLDLKKGDAEVILKRSDDNVWRFEKPALGFAGFESSAPEEKEKVGIKALLGEINRLNVEADDDFLPLGQPLANYGLEAKKASLRIDVASTSGFDKKEKTETLLVGNAIPGEPAFYARRDSDEGVVKLHAKQLEPIERALAEPGKIRSKDVAAIDVAKVEKISLKQGAKSLDLERPDAKSDWKLITPGQTPRKANESATKELLDALQGKNAIVEFVDLQGEDAKKFDSESQLDAPTTQVSVFTGEGEPGKKSTKLTFSLAFGKTDKDQVVVKRTLPDGSVTRFRMAKAILDRVQPTGGTELAYVDTAIPGPDPNAVSEVILERGAEKIELVHKNTFDPKTGRVWYLKDPQEPSGLRLADASQVNLILNMVHKLKAKKWESTIDAKADLETWGLKSPTLLLKIVSKNDSFTPQAVAKLLSSLGTQDPCSAWASALSVNQGEVTKLQFGKDLFARTSAIERIFQTEGTFAEFLRKVELSDKSIIKNTQPALDVGQVGVLLAGGPGWLLASPLITGSILNLDPSQVKDVRIAVRSSEELRILQFVRDEKSWKDKSNLQEFQLDADRVEKLVETFAHLRSDRLVNVAGGPRPDQKLSAKDYAFRCDLIQSDGKTISILAGAEFERAGRFGFCTAWPDVVFIMPMDLIDPILRRPVGYFSKERVAAIP